MNEADKPAPAGTASPRERALREILDVISVSRDDERPVFKAILENAARLCGAPHALLLMRNEAGTHLELLASSSAHSKLADSLRARPHEIADKRSGAVMALDSMKTQHLPDVRELYRGEARAPQLSVAADVEGMRTVMLVPMIAGGRAVGIISVYKLEIAPFSDAEIALVETFAAQAIIAIENVRQFREVQTRLERETASREILGVISRSRDDEAPVFDVILESAARLCAAPLADLDLVDEDGIFLREVATYGTVDRAIPSERWVWRMDSDYRHVKAVRDGEPVHVPDLRETPAYMSGDAMARATVDEENMRTLLAVPLRQGDKALGCIVLFRQQVHPFTEDEIGLVQTFAAQAVIAIENARQFREVRTRLERERATKNVLSVISKSRDDEMPVFKSVLENAARLCHAGSAALLLGRPDQPHLKFTAYYSNVGTTTRRGEDELLRLREEPMEMDPKAHLSARAICEARSVQIEDLSQDPRYLEGEPSFVGLVEIAGERAILSVPLIDSKGALGAINLHRQLPGPFAEDEVELVESFAAQAVIAIENARQFRDVQTRLEREEASREVLQLISVSRTDPVPVFDMILKQAAQLSGAPLANLCLLNSERSHWNLVAHFGDGLRHLAVGQPPRSMDSNLTPAVAMRTARVTQVEDLTKTELYKQGDPGRVAMVEEEGMRTILGVPLLDEDGAIGCITLFRREVKAFSDDEIALVESFAAQAVIAIENVQQFNEVQVRLEREAASREILEVINQSPDDEDPVFNTIMELSGKLCWAPISALFLRSADDKHLNAVAARTDSPELEARIRENPHRMDDTTSLTVEAVLSKEIRYYRDLSDTSTLETLSEHHRATLKLSKMRSLLYVPLILGERAIGTILVASFEPNDFTEDDARLLETFAAQAVIAIENVRQFREVRDRLEREEATSQILHVVSQSREDDLPVFNTITSLISRLCDAPLAYICILNHERTQLTIPSQTGARPAFAERLERFCEPVENESLLSVRATIKRETIRIDDLADDDLYREGDEYRVNMVDEEGMRSAIFVPLISSNEGIGCIVLYRREVAPFSEDDIGLVKTFAAQAVIAIENVRQFKALESLNAELGERVEEQVGEIERMGLLKRFLPAAVADTVVSQGADKLLTSHRALLGVLFCDIRGFTAFCETAEPEETIEVLQTYHEEMGKLISDHGAGVDHRMGDGIMVLFNDPLPCDDPAGEALRLAQAMQARMAELCKAWKRLGHRLGFGVGISLGYATVGMVGYEGRYDNTASGTAVNLASRLCDKAEDGEILLSPRAATALEDEAEVEKAGIMELKGFREAIDVFRVVQAKD